MSLSPVLSPESNGFVGPCVNPGTILRGVPVRPSKRRLGCHGPWKIPAGKSESAAFAAVSDEVACLVAVVVFRDNCIFIADQSGSGKPYAAGEYTLRYQRGTSLFVTVVRPSCLRLSYCKSGDEHLGGRPIVLSHGERMVKIGANHTFFCGGCGKIFEDLTAICDHLTIPVGMPLQKKGKHYHKFAAVSADSRFASYLKEAENGVWDQTYLPSVSAWDLSRKLQDLQARTAHSI